MASYSGPSVPTGPYSAIGAITNVEARTKPKKAGGTFTVNVATLDTGIEVDFGFKPVEGKVGMSVSWKTMKEYGSYKFAGTDPAAGSYPPALPPRIPVPSFTATSPGAPSAPRAPAGMYSTKPFPLPREHGDTAIIRQNALTNAVATVGHSIGIVDSAGMPTSLDALSDMIIKLAYKYANFSSGNLDAILAEDLAERTKVAKSPKAA